MILPKAERRISQVTQAQINKEYLRDCERFEIHPALTREVYDRAASVGLAVRKWVEQEALSAYTINFRETEGSNPGLPVMPFVECSTAMVAGIGYAGEGDVLTAALVAAVLTAHEDATFTEMFCPDWQHGSVFLSHMGEFNYNAADGKPILMEKPFPFTSAQNPTVAYRCLRGGRAVFMNLAPLGQGRYTMTLAPGEMLKIRGENRMPRPSTAGSPSVALPEFLERYSAVGATHHSVLVYGDSARTTEDVGKVFAGSARSHCLGKTAGVIVHACENKCDPHISMSPAAKRRRAKTLEATVGLRENKAVTRWKNM